MELKEIVWKANNNGGQTAYVGTIRIGGYHFNGIDSKNGTYVVSSNLPQSMLIKAKVFEVEEAKDLIISEWYDFLKKISK